MRRVISLIHGPAFGGTHNQLLRLHGPLRERGYDTVAVLPDEAEAAADRLRSAGVETHTTPLGRLRASRDLRAQAAFLRRSAGDTRRVERILAETSADVVQVHGVHNPQGAIAGRRRGAAIVWQLPDTRAPMALRRLSMPVVRSLADVIVSWGASVAREHPGATRLGERLVVVFPPVVAAEFTPDATARHRARERLGVLESRPLVGTVGVRTPQKGHLDLVRAAAAVHRSRPEAAFRILGAASPAHPDLDGRLLGTAAELGLRVPDDLDLVDPGADVPGLIQALDVFVMTSEARSEGMPTAILEAMAAGKAVVATDVGSTSELVAEGRTGLLVPPGDPNAAAGAIDRLLADDELRGRFGDAGRRRAVESFGLDALADRHARAYELALSRRERRRAS